MIKEYYIDINTGAIRLLLVATQDQAQGGYLPCNGASVACATYPALYAVVGDSFTDPPGSGVNFTVPTLPLVMI